MKVPVTNQETVVEIEGEIINELRYGKYRSRQIYIYIYFPLVGLSRLN